MNLLSVQLLLLHTYAELRETYIRIVCRVFRFLYEHQEVI